MAHIAHANYFLDTENVFARREGRSNEKASFSFDAAKACSFAPLRQGCFQHFGRMLACAAALMRPKQALDLAPITPADPIPHLRLNS